MTQSSVFFRFQPKKGPPLSPFKIAILDRLQAELALFPSDSVYRRSQEQAIAFILRQNCRCPDDSLYCMCGGGFDPQGGNSAL